MSLRVVVDANIVASALIRPAGWTASELKRKDVSWLAPDFLFKELLEHSDDYALKAGCSRQEWKERINKLAKQGGIVPWKDLVAASGNPLVVAVERIDPDDAPYAAAFVAARADLLWTRDKALLHVFQGRAVLVLPRTP